MEPPQAVMNLFQNRQLSMNQKMVALYMFTPSQSLPPVASLPDFSDLEQKIEEMIKTGKLTIHGFNHDGSLKYTLHD